MYTSANSYLLNWLYTIIIRSDIQEQAQRCDPLCLLTVFRVMPSIVFYLLQTMFWMSTLPSAASKVALPSLTVTVP